MSDGEEARKCSACGKPSTTVCPVCSELQLPETPYCSQTCFKAQWKSHKKIHRQRAAELFAESNAARAAAGDLPSAPAEADPAPLPRGTCAKCGKGPAPYECPTCKEHVSELGETRYCSSECFTSDFAEHRRHHETSGVVKVDPQAELRYAGCLLLGLGGVERDPLAAVAVFEGLVADGEPRAMAYLALCLEGGAENAQNGVAPDGSRAVALYEAAVAAGDSLAHAQLARILHDGCCKGGHPVPQDPERAARLYKVGADAGDPLSRHMYACALDAGLGVERDAEAAFAMFEENSKVFWESMLHVAGHYAMGRGKGKEDSSAATMTKEEAKKDPRGVAAVTRALQLSCAEQSPVALYAFAQWMRARKDPDLLVTGSKGGMSYDERIDALESDGGEVGAKAFANLPEEMQRAFQGGDKKK